ncbi:MAG TPA: ABC transporter substrate-binding protein, partial [Candidatus Methylomirabilis sp.]|nr:ABC transporter substrate-binding protein [Candidatus Methylomirabilis sp.]
MHPYIPELKEDLRRGRIDRREFMRLAALLGLTPLAVRQVVASVAHAAQAGPVTAGGSPRRGGVIRAAERVQRMDDPARLQWVPSSNICRHVAEYLTYTDHENVTHPYLAERWEPSADAKTWTFFLRKGVKFNTGKELTADDVVWNLKRWLDPKTGSSIRGLMSYLGPDNIQKVDSYTIRLHLERA